MVIGLDSKSGFAFVEKLFSSLDSFSILYFWLFFSVVEQRNSFLIRGWGSNDLDGLCSSKVLITSFEAIAPAMYMVSTLAKNPFRFRILN